MSRAVLESIALGVVGAVALGLAIIALLVHAPGMRIGYSALAAAFIILGGLLYSAWHQGSWWIVLLLLVVAVTLCVVGAVALAVSAGGGGHVAQMVPGGPLDVASPWMRGGAPALVVASAAGSLASLAVTGLAHTILLGISAACIAATLVWSMLAVLRLLPHRR